MNKLFDALETCLQEMEDGADLDLVLSHFPEFAAELRPILKTAGWFENFDGHTSTNGTNAVPAGWINVVGNG